VKLLLSKEYAASRRKEIDPLRAAQRYAPASIGGRTADAGRQLGYQVEGRDHGDTIYMTVADGKGNMVSLIQSLFDTFGSGVVAGNTGIALHNRGSLFTLEPGHPNRIAPHKRPFHTLIPAFVMKDGKPWMSFGVMGGDMQPQGQVQVLVNLIDFGMTVQEAGEAPRLEHIGSATPTGRPGAADGGTVVVERGFPSAIVEELERRGHHSRATKTNGGGYQGILIDPTTNMLHGGSEARKDGCAVGY
jgi:gamma-glutamyltranspeptidase / glutathione hydrolase